jgi:hypothetical protein
MPYLVPHHLSDWQDGANFPTSSEKSDVFAVVSEDNDNKKKGR